MTLRSYDLSIISDQEAAERIGVMAAEREELFLEELDDYNRQKIQHAKDDYGEMQAYAVGANRATIALDILALRKAQVRLSRGHGGVFLPLDLFTRLQEFLDQKADIRDREDGPPIPNEAMRLLAELDEIPLG